MSSTEPEPKKDPGLVIARFAAICAADDRIAAAFLGGSHARGQADAHSDIDLCMVASDERYHEVRAGRAAFVRGLGEPLFLESFGSDRITHFILADGTEGELIVESESGLDEIRAGPLRALVDEKGILPEHGFPLPVLDRERQAEELRRILTWFWHDLSHLVAALGRDQLWWAAGQLEALRGYCVNLARIEQGVEALDEPYEKLDRAMATARIDALRSTFVAVGRDAMLGAGRDILAFFRERAPIVARAHGATYPAELDRIVGGRLDRL